jgi:CHAD domain-containing protein
MRKKAGDVRDMDVLTGFSATLSSGGNDECLVKLLEHLGQERGRGASKLRKTIAQHKRAARRSLKGCVSLLEKNFDKRDSAKLKEWPIDAMADAMRISGELSSWPRLSSENLHAFRLKVKEMRYVLQLSGDDSELTERLGEVKDQIGEWHDWTELDAIAKRILSDCKHCKVIGQIEQIGKQKLESALKGAQQLRSIYFEPQGGRQKRNSKRITIKEPVLKASAALEEH